MSEISAVPVWVCWQRRYMGIRCETMTAVSAMSAVSTVSAVPVWVSWQWRYMWVRCETMSAMTALSAVFMWVKCGTLYPMSAMSAVSVMSAMTTVTAWVSFQCRYYWSWERRYMWVRCGTVEYLFVPYPSPKLETQITLINELFLVFALYKRN